MADSAFTWTGAVRPICQVGTGDAQTAEPAGWQDVSCYVHQAELNTGRSRFNDRFQVGTASVTFNNENGWADLYGASGPAVAARALRPGRPLRIGVEGAWAAGATVRWLWRGWIDQTTPAYDPADHDFVTANCIDAFGEAGSSVANEGPFQGAHELVSARINRVLDTVGWFPTKRKIAVDTTPVQGTTLGGGGIDLMGQAADSDGGVVFGDLDGDVVFRNRDWMLYDPDTPPDGVVGNVAPGVVPPFTPPYIDPGVGYVYDPAPPPFEHPVVLKVCANGTDGTLIQQGDSYTLYAENGQLLFMSEGHLFDLGAFDGGCTGVVVDAGGVPTRIDEDEDGTWIEAFEAGVEIPLPPPVELIAWSDHGAAQTPVTSVDTGPITPGSGCVLVVLFNAVGTESVPTEGLEATIAGGDLTWVDVWHRDAPDVGASGWVWVAEVGRSDPGTFTPSITWPEGELGAHCCTVWRCIRTADGFVARCVDGTVLQAVTNSNPPDEIEPGNGPNSAELESRTGTVDPPTAVTDVTIAQSLADEITPPYGAVFDDAEGVWIVPDLTTLAPPAVTALIAAFSDDFERADGPIGAPWELPTGTPSPGVGSFVTPQHHNISSGSAFGPITTSAGVMAVDFRPEEVTGDHYIESEFHFLTDWVSGVSSEAYFYLLFDPDSWSGVSAWILQNSDGFRLRFIYWIDGAQADVTGLDYFHEWGGGPRTVTMRFEATIAGVVRAFVDGVAVDVGEGVADGLVPGTRFGIGTRAHHFFGAGIGAASPRIDIVSGGGAGDPRRTSWVAGYRPDAVASNVAWTDVNLGTADIQSTQTAIVTQHAPTDDDTLVVGGLTDPFNGPIYSAGSYQGADPNDDSVPNWIISLIEEGGG